MSPTCGKKWLNRALCAAEWLRANTAGSALLVLLILTVRSDRRRLRGHETASSNHMSSWLAEEPTHSYSAETKSQNHRLTEWRRRNLRISVRNKHNLFHVFACRRSRELQWWTSDPEVNKSDQYGGNCRFWHHTHVTPAGFLCVANHHMWQFATEHINRRFWCDRTHPDRVSWPGDSSLHFIYSRWFFCWSAETHRPSVRVRLKNIWRVFLYVKG